MSLSDNYLRDLARRIAEATETPLGTWTKWNEDHKQVWQRYIALKNEMEPPEASLQARTEWIWGWLVAIYKVGNENELRKALESLGQVDGTAETDEYYTFPM